MTTNMIIGLIPVINIIASMGCEALISLVKYPTVTSQIAAVTVTIFAVYFFNLSILMLLSNADLSQVWMLDWIPVRGPFPDLTESWYLVIAP